MSNKKQHRRPLSRTSTLHYFKLVFRSCLFLSALIMYLVNRIGNTGSVFGGFENSPIILILIWLVFVVEMILRFFPIKVESMGCQKQFARNFISTKEANENKVVRQSPKPFVLIAVLWVILNGIIGGLYFANIIDQGILLLISLAYSVCDLICILFFCPFQLWFMKNKCCVSCRIYNWDYAMMFTPLIFVKGIYTWSILALAIGLLIKWEIMYHTHPERFSETYNENLTCKNCQEKLCHHKKSLRAFLTNQWNKHKHKV